MNKLSTIILTILMVACTGKQSDQKANFKKIIPAKKIKSYSFKETFYSTTEKKIFHYPNLDSIKNFKVKPFTLFSIVRVATNNNIVWFGLGTVVDTSNTQPRSWIVNEQLILRNVNILQKKIKQLKGQLFFDEKKENVFFLNKNNLAMYLIRCDSYHPFDENKPDYKLYKIISDIMAISNVKSYAKITASGLLSKEKWLSARSEIVANYALEPYKNHRPIIVKHYGDYVVIPALKLKLYRGQYKKKKTTK